MNTHPDLNTTPAKLRKTREEKQLEFERENRESKAARRREINEARDLAMKQRLEAARGKKSLFDEIPDLTLVPTAAGMSCTDHGLTERFAIYYGATVFFAQSPAGGGDFYIYNGKRWELDHGAIRVNQYMRNVIRSITLHEAKECGGDDDQVTKAKATLDQALELGAKKGIEEAERALKVAERGAGYDRIKWGEKCENGTGHIDAAVKGLHDMLGRTNDGLDADPDLLNCQNGTLDLRTLELRPHDPADMLTKIVTVDYDPDATHPDIEIVFENIERNGVGLAEFMMRYLGMALTGNNDARPMLVIKGEAGIGKTTLIQAFCKMMGISDIGYAGIVNPLVFAINPNARGNEANDNHHNMRGKRCLFADEAEYGWLNAVLMKGLATGSTQNTRPTYGKPMSWDSQAKTILVGNSWMAMPDNDPGIESRLIALEMFKKLDKKDLDTNLQTRLESVAGRTALLALTARYAKIWYDEGTNRDALKITDDMLESAQECMGGGDPLADFWEAEMMEVDLDSRDYYPMTGEEIFQNYSAFCRARGASTKFDRTIRLVQRLNKRGFFAANTEKKMVLGDRSRISKGRRYFGLRNTAVSFDGQRDKYAVAQDELIRDAARPVTSTLTLLDGGRGKAAPAPVPAPVEVEEAPDYTAEQLAQLDSFEDCFAA